ncbi:unnamed protein product [Rotaria magnacalcarata]|uniref:Uncharacterized protein n=1 Tax=Rotaria magnacalcarata TaxID=392030 RepID=A0A816PBI3_9BILA|nr:unnamed protein product [Rotaria magnacalcarata]CAF1520378.1 unnamed protein product [Rotaria magnacalcarata]CAF2046888.1 unnamed protein product [Rotaria magnacalcarata]CAF3756298.1 unnamed protein product [Rotaria magnacalcarata]CAF3819158.1 unnamed protein product [Rotaria magnacalcarata]
MSFFPLRTTTHSTSQLSIDQPGIYHTSSTTSYVTTTTITTNTLKKHVLDWLNAHIFNHTPIIISNDSVVHDSANRDSNYTNIFTDVSISSLLLMIILLSVALVIVLASIIIILIKMKIYYRMHLLFQGRYCKFKKLDDYVNNINTEDNDTKKNLINKNNNTMNPSDHLIISMYHNDIRPMNILSTFNTLQFPRPSSYVYKHVNDI